jgi:hypothetical protein
MSYKYNPLRDNKYLKGKCSLDLTNLKNLKPSSILESFGNDHKTPQWRLISNGQLFGADNSNHLSEKELISLYEFIVNEAQVFGYWETVNDNYLKSTNPFSENLLDGLPRNDWNLYYEEGSRHARFESSSLEISKRFPSQVLTTHPQK